MKVGIDESNTMVK